MLVWYTSWIFSCACILLCVSSASPVPAPGNHAKSDESSAPVIRHSAVRSPGTVPMEEWQCGATEWDKTIAHQLANESCPILMRDANMCCLAHDVCYAEHFSQEACDQAFCECLNTMAEEARGTQYAMGCLDASQWFCFAVKMFGHSAHGSAKEALANESMAQNETDATSETAQSLKKTLTLASTVGTPPSETDTPSPTPAISLAHAAEVSRSFGVFVQNSSVNCSMKDVSKCVVQLQDCASLKTSVTSLPCFRQFCDCMSQRTPSSRWGCSTGIDAMCSHITRSNDTEGGSQVLIHLWSLNLYKVRPYPNTLTTVLLLFLIVVVVVLLFPSRFYKVLRQKKPMTDPNLTTSLRRSLRSASEGHTDGHHHHHFLPLTGSKSNHVADATEQP